MATISKRSRKNGKPAYTAQIRLKRKGRIIHTESRTFPLKKDAEAWAKRRETELADAGELRRATADKITVAEAIDLYQATQGHGIRRFGRTKTAALEFLKNCELGPENALTLTPQRLIDHVVRRRQSGAGPATTNNDLIWLRVVFKYVRPACDIPVDVSVVEDAMALCRKERYIGRARRRDRRPTPGELDALSDYFRSRDGRAQIPMHDIFWFAVHSARRQAEITRLLWEDNHDHEQTGVVRNHKHPREKEGNHKRFKYPPEAWRIVQRQPRTDRRIFPYNPKSVGAAFTRACRVLEIKDLHFHDLRHEATSRLFERGLSIPQVQLVTLHEDWGVLKTYTNLRPGDLQT